MKKKKAVPAKGKAGKEGILKQAVMSRGFYITLLVLAAVVGASFYVNKVQNDFLAGSSSFDENAWQEAIEESNLSISNEENQGEFALDNEEEAVWRAQDEESVIARQSSFDEETVTVSAEIVVEDKFVIMQMPCQGEVIADCSLDELVYCSTMEDWRTHNGVDIAASIGEPVVTAADGVVSSVYEDDMYGVVVEVDHGENFITRYGNLQNTELVRPGDEVYVGDVIGKVGQPGVLETGTQTHVHFEVLADGEHKNPWDYLMQ